MTSLYLILYCFILLLAPTCVLGLREDSPFATDTYDLPNNVSAEYFEAESLLSVPPLIQRSAQGQRTSEAAVRWTLTVVNMGSACDQGTHAVLSSLAHPTRSAVLENATRKAANVVTTVATVVLGATVERVSGRSPYATGISPMKK
ncbi:hypothetical protein BDV32DRAFT_147855 [Aspergillus pseudonomiae]|uniref:Uncharacterized protein n=1 Tax=Aspergillus pseudonomiae TaxID=1506151 RepID=A0A5N6IAT0_9EURO|nr:uncharacterized protein BDV37DRAFT_285498 [Aspergillus pseudonomiae]KAB8262203.1 hypothetical protein BDV32DRAFT_147855 [Aspergillus pseudonomiae]KAE8401637.1 hypothetical protein BDV37DRAFT_285498 [Aspergillus pseudonomiae]